MEHVFIVVQYTEHVILLLTTLDNIKLFSSAYVLDFMKVSLWNLTSIALAWKTVTRIRKIKKTMPVFKSKENLFLQRISYFVISDHLS